MSARFRNGFSRRDFLKLAGGAVGAGALAAYNPFALLAQSGDLPYTARLAIEQASVPDFAEVPQIWAQSSGAFADNGVNLDIIETGGGASVAVEPLQLLVSERIDFTDVLFPAGFDVALQGAPLVGLGTFATGGRYDYWLVTKDDIVEWEDLIGRKYVISSPGAPPDGIGRYALTRNNIAIDQVEFVPLGGSSARTQALLAGEVDAALIHPLDALQLIKDNPGIHVFSTLAEAPLLFGIDATFARNIEENRDMVVAYTKTVIQAVRQFVDDQDFAINAYTEIVPEADPELVAEAWEDFIARGVWNPNGDVDRELFDATIDTYVAAGALPEKLAFEDFVDPTIVEDVLAEIGRVEVATSAEADATEEPTT
jgi:ABC-type nitrate/sulfonate/bicarbonate transport system substrate-binding protein